MGVYTVSTCNVLKKTYTGIQEVGREVVVFRLVNQSSRESTHTQTIELLLGSISLQCLLTDIFCKDLMQSL